MIKAQINMRYSISGRTGANLLSGIMGLALIVSVQSCSSWTEPESLDFTPKVEDKPAEYYDALKAFKQSEHKISIVALEGTSEQPKTQMQHIMALPDSVDYVCMRNVSGLFPTIAEEIPQVYEKKGTKVLCDVDYMKISDAWQAMEDAKDEGEAPGTEDEFAAYVIEQTKLQIACCDQYSFHGIMVSYSGTRSGMAVRGQEEFMALVNEWRTSHPDHEMLFTGYPLNVIDASVFDHCRYIVIPVGTVYSSGEFTRTVQRYAGKLTDGNKAKIVVETNVPSEAYPQQDGYDPQPIAAAKWCLEADDTYTRCGICVDNTSDDYLITGTYSTIRKAISVMNSAAPEVTE